MLVLSLFPGIGLLDMAFEEEGFVVVRGPDVLWGGDIRRFHPPAGKFDGVIGGPPCKAFSSLANIVKARYGPQAVAANLIPEFERCIAEAEPLWFIMENVKRAPVPKVDDYNTVNYVMNARHFGSDQNRERRFTFGYQAWRTFRDGSVPELQFERKPASLFFEPCVTSAAGGRRAKPVRDANGRVRGKQGDSDWHRLQNRSIEDNCELQGLPRDFTKAMPFTAQGKKEIVGNGVPLPMGRAIARAVKEAIGPSGYLA